MGPRGFHLINSLLSAGFSLRFRRYATHIKNRKGKPSRRIKERGWGHSSNAIQKLANGAKKVCQTRETRDCVRLSLPVHPNPSRSRMPVPLTLT